MPPINIAGSGVQSVLSSGSLFLESWRPLAMENTNVKFRELTLTNIPTSDPNNPGQVWNDAGTLKISEG